jgi:uncharacterized membrane protein
MATEIELADVDIRIAAQGLFHVADHAAGLGGVAFLEQGP